VRDRALLLFAWSSGGRRRSEVANATIERLEEHGEDFVYRLGITKTSQDGDTGTVPVAGRAAEAMRHWLEVLDRTSGPIFRGIMPNGVIQDDAMHPETVAVIVRRRARQAGLDARRFAGHSLRSGFMTEAGFQGLDIREAMDMSSHKTMQVAAGYYQAGHGLKNRAARLAG
jgi:integrase